MKRRGAAILTIALVLAVFTCCVLATAGIAIQYVWGGVASSELAGVFPDSERTTPPPSAGRSVITETTQVGLESPFLFDGDNCPPEDSDGCSLDIGVKENQLGLVFGWYIMWPDQGLDTGGDGCDLVLLRSGWYENLWMLDARYEVYDLPETDRLGWIEVLATQRADEQSADYGCPAKIYKDLPWWESTITSPPPNVSTGISPVTSQQTSPTSQTVSQTVERRATGQNQSLTFEEGEAVYGWQIVLDSGAKCDEGECYLASAPTSGSVTSGVINPWPAEVQGVEPWVPES